MGTWAPQPREPLPLRAPASYYGRMSTDHFLFEDPSQPIGARVRDLVSRMTTEEKVAQTVYDAPAIPRLGVPDYNWWNECLHGVARAGVATVFPQAIGMASSFNTELMERVADVIAEEGRAKFHEADRKGDHGIYKGLTFWTPNINIFRDPRWGRGQETYGEDPYLTGRMGVAFVRGLQGDHPVYFKAIATPKHYAVHSGPESLRHEFDAVVDEKTLRETYLPAFRECVVEAGAYSIMGAYNRTNGEACCASPTLLQKILRDEWGFDGYVVSDCGAIADIHEHHKLTRNAAESAALAVKAGCELNCGKTYPALVDAVKQGLLSEEDLDRAVERLFTARFKLGLFDPPPGVSYASIPYEKNACAEHRSLALETARQSIVLLKNRDRTLPLSKNLNAVAVIGPNAANPDIIIANYFGTPSMSVTPLQGIQQAVSADTRVYYAEGCELASSADDRWRGTARRGFAEALSAAERADAVVMCLGLSAALEGEEGSTTPDNAEGDRKDLALPGMQQELLEEVTRVGKPVVLVLFNGSPVEVNWAQEHVDAVVEAWYPGETGGTAVADVLFGDYNPAGRLAVTFPASLDQLPDFTDYSMKGRTYRYMTDEPLYPFGYGLSYTEFEYSDLVVEAADAADLPTGKHDGDRGSAGGVTTGSALTFSVVVRNTGDCAGDEVAQLYLRRLNASVDVPLRSLAGIRRVHLAPGAETKVTFTVTPRQTAVVRKDGSYVVEPGEMQAFVGGRQPDDRSLALTGRPVLSTLFSLSGGPVRLPN